MPIPVHEQTLLEETADYRLLVKAGEEKHCTEQEGPVGALLHVAVQGVQDFRHLNGRRGERRAPLPPPAGPGHSHSAHERCLLP